jgi:hypothetical protein
MDKVAYVTEYACDSLSRIRVSSTILASVESPCIRDPLGCVCIGLLGLVWGETQPLDYNHYIIVILLLKSIEQPFSPLQQQDSGKVNKNPYIHETFRPTGQKTKVCL